MTNFQGADSQQSLQKLSHSIGSNLQKISQNVNSIQRMVEQIGTPQDSDQLRGKLHEIQHYTGALAKDTSKLLKDLALVDADDSVDERQWKLQKDRLLNDFSVVLTNFQASQRVAAQKEKASVLRARANSGLSDNPFADSAAKISAKDDSLSAGSTGVSETQVVIEKNVDLQAIQQRERDIKQLEADIVDVNQIFKDLAVMVHEQGDMLDSIESNVERAAEHTDQGYREVSRAAQYQSRRRKSRMICWIILAIVILLLVLIIYVAAR